MAAPTPAAPAPTTASAGAGAGEDHTYKFNIQMNCGGCSGAIDRVLKKLDGVSSYSVSLEDQSAEVHTSSLDYATVLDKIRKTGKTVLGAEVDGVKADV